MNPPQDADTVVIGESVMPRPLANAIMLEYGVKARVICPLETRDGVLSDNDLLVEDEEDIAAAMRGAKNVIADPLYKPITPADCRFYPLPHEAFSGRLFRKSISNIIRRFLELS